MSNVKVYYGKWAIEYNPKPAPTNDFDWDGTHEDYEGDGDDRYFEDKSCEGIIKQIDEWREDNE